ncbi:MAG TPA: hypothetical protein DEQ20_04175 [Desulfobulbaceae bacterium]|nr:hypothetical protein [Desulfobulbaceae bacterium]
MLALFQGGEVEKTEIYRFFDLVDKIPSQQHIGDMGLHQGYFRGGMGVGLRFEQGLNEWRQG